MHYIYIITNLKNYKVYVGQTHTPKNRWSAHKCEAKSERARYPIHFALRKYGEENFQFCLIDCAVSQEEINKLETYWIEQFDSLNNNMGYNLAVGGNSNSGWHHTEESKRKISESNMGKIFIFSEEAKKKISVAMTGREITWGDKISKSNMGKVFSEEAKNKMSRSAMGKITSNETKEKQSKSMIGKYSGEKSYKAKLTWELVKQIREEYSVGDISLKELAKKYGVFPTTIHAIIKNRSWKI